MVYLPHWAFTPVPLSFRVPSARPRDPLISEMQRAIWDIDPPGRHSYGQVDG
jgi:hypothetical protein